MKSKGIAYLLLIFLGTIGAHRFYIGKIGTGILFLFTLGFIGIGVLIDLFTLGNQVDMYNLKFGGAMNQKQNQNQAQNIVVNVASPVQSDNQNKEIRPEN